MKLIIHFFRHGESCANVVQKQNTCGTIKHLLMQDPQLTDKGVSISIECSKYAPKVDIVLSSQLLRAIQTATLTYPNKFIHIVPYLNELGTGLDNVPLQPEYQKIYLENNFHRIIWSNNSHEKSFMEYIKKYILPRFNQEEVHIALFTHSRLMRKHLNKQFSELPNNIMITKTYVL